MAVSGQDRRRSAPSRSECSRARHRPISERATGRRGSETSSARVRSGLAELFALPEGYEVVLGNGGTTAFWDAATFCLVGAQEPAPVVRRVLLQVRRVHPVGAVPRGPRGPRLRGRAPTRGRSPTRPWTPTASPTTRPRPGCRPPCSDLGEPTATVAEGLVLVDGTSAAGGLRVEAGRVRRVLLRSQKCFGSEGGLWLALLSPAAIERVEHVSATGRFVPAFLDLKIAIGELPAAADLQHTGSGHLAPSRRAGRLVLGQRRPRVGRFAVRTAPPRSSTAGPSGRASRSPS